MDKRSPIDKPHIAGRHPHHLSQRIELVRDPSLSEPLPLGPETHEEQPKYCVECLLAGRNAIAVEAASQLDPQSLPLCSECIALHASRGPR